MKNLLKKIKKVHYCYSELNDNLTDQKSIFGRNLTDLCFQDYSPEYNGNITDIIEQNKSTLKRLRLFTLGVNDPFLNNISVMKELNLTTVHLSWCPSITDVGIKNLCVNQKNIKDLRIRQCDGITDNAMKTIVENLIDLRVFAIEDSSHINNVCLLCFLSSVRRT